MSAATMLWLVQGNLGLLIEGSQEHRDAEWIALLDGLQDAMTAHNRRVRVLVFTEGAGPNAVQRKLSIEKGWENNQSPIAVVTKSMMVRGILTAFSWFNMNLKAFAWDRAEEAYAFLDLTPSERQWVRIETKRLRTQLGLDPVAAVSKSG
jgi:hypothetical protein